MNETNRDNIIELMNENASLRAECAALRKDAERYRWLRNEANFGRKHDPICVTGIGPEATAIDGDELDAAIDAALAAKDIGR